MDELKTMYRIITGACRAGTEAFVATIKELKGTYSIREALEITRGQYNSEAFENGSPSPVRSQVITGGKPKNNPYSVSIGEQVAAEYERLKTAAGGHYGTDNEEPLGLTLPSVG